MVDDKSKDGTREYLRTLSQIRLIESNEETFCYARNNNKGIRVAQGEYICLLNNDTECHRGWLKELLRLLTSNPRYGAVGPKAKWLPVESNPGYLRFFCVLIKRVVIDKIGVMDEEFQGYGFDDNRYSERIRKAGYLLGMHAEELVEHHVSKSFAKKSRKILKDLTGMNVIDNTTAREKLLQINREIYEGIVHGAAPVVRDERQEFLSMLRTGEYYNREYFMGDKGYKGYGDHNVYWMGSAGEGLGKAIEEFKPRSILDVGCATGQVVHKARKEGYQAFGIDISEWACANAHVEIRSFIKQGSATNIPYDNEAFDLVWSRDLLQCVEDIYIPRIVSEMARVCKQRGAIWISSLGAMHKYSNRMRKRFEKKHETHINIQTVEYWINQFKRIDRRVVLWFSLDPDVFNEATLIRYDLNQSTKKRSTKQEIQRLIYATTN